MRRSHSRNRLLFVLTLILAVAFVGGSLINYLITRASIHKEIMTKDLPLTMDNIYSDLTFELQRPILVSSSMAADTFLKEWTVEGEKDTTKIVRYLDQIRARYGFFTAFFVSANSHNYYHYRGIHKIISANDSHDVWYYRFIESGREYDLDVDTDEASNNTLTIFINNRVVDEKGQLLGVTGVGLKVDNAAQLIKKYREKYDRSVFLTDRDGLIQVHQDLSFIEKKNISQIEGLSGLASDILKTRDTLQSFQYNLDGERILLNVRYISTLNWLLYVQQNETKALAGARMNFLRTVLIGLVASIVVISLTVLTINRYQRQLELLIVTDELTGVANRRRLEVEFSRAVYLYSRSGQVFSLILIDLDGFKRVNDMLGHQVGDAVLKEVAQLIGGAIRPTDVLARWGGDEFAILAVGDSLEACKMADRIRRSLEDVHLAGTGAVREDPRNLVTLSAGVTLYHRQDTLDSMLIRSDQALYLCKKAGGNRVEQVQPETTAAC